MLTKLSTFRGVSKEGEPLVRLFDPGLSLVKQAGDMMPVIKKWMDAYQPDDNKIAVLVNALGASEYWGQNVNGDIFPESSLVHDCAKHPATQHPYDDFTGKVIPSYGAWTFMDAHPFVHHQNKDPNRAFGKVVLWTWNPKMHRVELVILLDKNLALQYGAQHVIDRIMAGEFPDVSMGCFKKGTLIFMADGNRTPIELVQEGDEVLTHLGNARRVTSTMVRHYTDPAYRLKAYGHPEMVVTGEHPLWMVRGGQVECRPSSKSVNRGRRQRVCSPEGALVKKGCHGCTTSPDYKFEWVRTDEAEIGDYLAQPVPSYDTDVAFTNEEARLLGYYLAEGHILRSKAGNVRGIQFSTGLEDHRFREDFESLVEAMGLGENYSSYEVPERGGVYLSLWGVPELAEMCLKHCGSYASDKRLSTDLMGQDPRALKVFLGAYANGDGGTYKGSLYFSTVSSDLANQISQVVLRCGMVPSIGEIHHKPSDIVKIETVEHRVWVGTDTSWKMDGFTYKPVSKSKKANSRRFFVEKGGSTWLMTPIEVLVVEEYDDDVYNFSVDGHESYVAEGLAVHNCRVPYDVCTLCGHKSKTRKDYCNCIRFMGMNKIMDDGRQIGVVNTYPRFFDISFVFIGADKTAKVMCKLGSEMLPQSILDADLLYGEPSEEGGLVKAASVQVPSNLYSGGLDKLASRRDEIVDFYVKRAEGGAPSSGAGTSGIDLGAETLGQGPDILPPPAVASRTDPQIDEQRRAVADGLLRTNADVNETDEFPEPLMPGRGKTASPLKQLFLESREKTAADPSMLKRLGAVLDKGYSRTFNSRLGRAGAGAVIGGAMGAGFGDENRLLAGGIGAGAGALAGLGIGRLGRQFGDIAGESIMINEVKSLSRAVEKASRGASDLGTKLQINKSHVDHLASGPQTRDTLFKLRHLENEGRLLSKAFNQETRSGQQLGEKLREATDMHGKFRSAMETHGGTIGAAVGGLGAGALAAEPFQKLNAAGSEETGQYGSMQRVWDDAAKMTIGPPPKPNRKEFPFTGTINFRGLEIHVENKPGTVREGKGWKTNMKLAYGEFNGTRGVDKDKLDVYVGPYRDAPNAYIIHQNFVRGPNKGKYDEDKVMLGFESLEQAKLAYLAHYDSARYVRSATVMAFPLFKKAIIKKEVHGEKVASAYVHTMEKRADELKLEDLFNGSKTANRRSKVWRHSDGRELRRTDSGMGDWGQVKQASAEKYAALEPRDLLKVSAEKWADIVKHIGPSKAVGKVSPMLSDAEPAIPKPELDAMSEQGMGKALSTPSMMGMVLKPEEFQRVCLNCMGKSGLADKMDDAGATFAPTEGEEAPCGELSSDQLDPEMMRMLMPLMRGRSYFGPAVRRRIIQISIIQPKPLTSSTEVNSPLLSKVAAAYNWYRREQMKLAADAMTVVPNNPELHSGLYGMGDADLFGKSASQYPSGVDAKTVAVVLGSIPLTLMYSAHLRGKQRKGEDIGLFKDLVAEHPWLATMGTSAALRELMKTPKAKQVIGELMGAGKRIFRDPASSAAL